MGSRSLLCALSPVLRAPCSCCSGGFACAGCLLGGLGSSVPLGRLCRAEAAWWCVRWLADGWRSLRARIHPRWAPPPPGAQGPRQPPGGAAPPPWRHGVRKTPPRVYALLTPAARSHLGYPPGNRAACLHRWTSASVTTRAAYPRRARWSALPACAWLLPVCVCLPWALRPGGLCSPCLCWFLLGLVVLLPALVLPLCVLCLVSSVLLCGRCGGLPSLLAMGVVCCLLCFRCAARLGLCPASLSPLSGLPLSTCLLLPPWSPP